MKFRFGGNVFHMGVDVIDGVLLGVVLKDREVKVLHDDEKKHEEIEKFLSNIVKLNNEDGEGIFRDNNPYSDIEKQIFYIGIFWEWSARRALNIDDLMTKLFAEDKKSEKSIQNNEGYKILKKRVHETLVNYIPSIKIEDVKFYHVRFWA